LLIQNGEELPKRRWIKSRRHANNPAPLEHDFKR
jgi:hypothetical protein